MEPKVTFISTFLNEETTIKKLLVSIFHQTKLPAEVILVDGGSTDRTREVIDETLKEYTHIVKKLRFIVLEKKGNRSVGRNTAIAAANTSIIVSSDAGCVLDKKWLEEIIRPFRDESVAVVAGYYKGEAKFVFQKCLIPYVLVMDDRVNPKTFLPATRSLAFRKSVWERVGKFPERYSHNEDYVFAKNLKKAHMPIVFVRKAVVSWLPRTNLRQAFNMFYRFAKGDVQANILRPKVVLLFVRYLLAIEIIFGFILKRNIVLLLILIGGIGLYKLWAIAKNYHYVKHWKAIFILPTIQFASDIAVMLGSIVGIFSKK